jgi:hypothetical protein
MLFTNTVNLCGENVSSDGGANLDKFPWDAVTFKFGYARRITRDDEDVVTRIVRQSSPEYNYEMYVFNDSCKIVVERRRTYIEMETTPAKRRRVA